MVLKFMNMPLRNFCLLARVFAREIFRFVYYPKEMFKEDYPEGFGELYNLEEDRGEMNNLYFEKEYGKKVDELQKDLMEWFIIIDQTKDGITEYII